MWYLWDSPLLTWLIALAITAFFLWYYLIKPFLKGKLSPSLARAVGRAIHWPKMPFALGSFYVGLRPCAYWSQIDDHVYLGALPTSWHKNTMKQMSIQAVVNLCDEDCGPLEFYKETGIEQLWLPTIDHYEPTLDAIKTAIKFIDYHVSVEHNVLIHCMIGRGRSAAVALCWLLHRHRDMDPQTAHSMLISKRPIVRQKLPDQQVVKQYYKECIQGLEPTSKEKNAEREKK